MFGKPGGDFLALRPLPGVKYRLVDDDGNPSGAEGRLVFLGNYSSTKAHWSWKPVGRHLSGQSDSTYEEYHTGDIFREEQTNGGETWLGYGFREDDLLVHTTGEMTNPLPTELGLMTALAGMVTNVCLVGTARPLATLIVELVPAAQRAQTLKEFAANLQCAVQETNKLQPEYSRLTPEQVIVVDPDTEKGLPVSIKGNVIRSAVEKQFSARLDMLYSPDARDQVPWLKQMLGEGLKQEGHAIAESLQFVKETSNQPKVHTPESAWVNNVRVLGTLILVLFHATLAICEGEVCCEGDACTAGASSQASSNGAANVMFVLHLIEMVSQFANSVFAFLVGFSSARFTHGQLAKDHYAAQIGMLMLIIVFRLLAKSVRMLPKTDAIPARLTGHSHWTNQMISSNHLWFLEACIVWRQIAHWQSSDSHWLWNAVMCIFIIPQAYFFAHMLWCRLVPKLWILENWFMFGDMKMALAHLPMFYLGLMAKNNSVLEKVHRLRPRHMWLLRIIVLLCLCLFGKDFVPANARQHFWTYKLYDSRTVFDHTMWHNPDEMAFKAIKQHLIVDLPPRLYILLVHTDIAIGGMFTIPQVWIPGITKLGEDALWCYVLHEYWNRFLMYGVLGRRFLAYAPPLFVPWQTLKPPRPELEGAGKLWWQPLAIAVFGLGILCQPKITGVLNSLFRFLCAPVFTLHQRYWDLNPSSRTAARYLLRALLLVAIAVPTYLSYSEYPLNGPDLILLTSGRMRSFLVTFWPM